MNYPVNHVSEIVNRLDEEKRTQTTIECTTLNLVYENLHINITDTPRDNINELL